MIYLMPYFQCINQNILDFFEQENCIQLISGIITCFVQYTIFL